MAVTIKVCGITRLEDAETVARLGVDALGFMFYEPSPRYVRPDAARILSQTVQGEVTRVGVFVNAPRATVEQLIESVGLDVLQFHGAETEAYCASFGLPYLKAFRVNGAIDQKAMEATYSSALAILLDTAAPGLPGGTGECFDWRQWPQPSTHNYMLAGGLTPGNVRSAVEQLRPWGVDVSTGVESQVKGIKDADKMSRFVQEVRNAECG